MRSLARLAVGRYQGGLPTSVPRGFARLTSARLNGRLIGAFSSPCHINEGCVQRNLYAADCIRPRPSDCGRPMPGGARMMRLETRDLVCQRGGREVFAGLSFSVSAGEALVLTGPNGAGKTSLLRLLAGLLRAVGGQIDLVEGDPELTLGEQAHYLGHQDALKSSLSVGENLHFWRRYYGGGGRDVTSALTAVGLDSVVDLPAAYLSAGQRRRLSIARLLAVRRPIWLLDEPTAALDTASQARLGALMKDQLAIGGIIIAATHGPLDLPGARELRLGGGR